MGSTVRAPMGHPRAPTVMSSRKAEKACECRGEEFISWRSCRGRRHVPRRSSRGPGSGPAPEEKAPGSRLCPPGCRIWALWHLGFSNIVNCMRIPSVFGLLCVVLVLASTCDRVGSRHPRASPARPPRNRIEGRLGGLMNVGDFKVESVEVDAYEKEPSEGDRILQGWNFAGRIGLSYRKGESSWKLEGAVDLGLK